MLNSPGVMITEQQWQNILTTSTAKPVRNGMSFKSILMPKKEESRTGSIMNNNEPTRKDERVFIPSPVVSSTDAFRLNTGLTPLPPKSPSELPTNGDAWHHSDVGE